MYTDVKTEQLKKLKVKYQIIWNVVFMDSKEHQKNKWILDKIKPDLSLKPKTEGIWKLGKRGNIEIDWPYKRNHIF